MTKRMNKFAVALTGALLVGGAVAGCGGGDGGNGGGGGGDAGDYCDAIKKAETDFGAMEGGDFSKLDKAFETFHTLADDAPSDVEDDWKVLEGAIDTMEKAFDDAGIKFSDLAEMQSGKMPEGFDASKLAGLSTTMAKFSDEKFQKASQNIAKHAKDECNVELAN